MPDYNLGTASGRIVVDGSAAETGFAVARSAAGAFFDTVKDRVNQIQNVGKTMAAVGTAGVAGFGLAIKAASGFETQMSGVQAVTGSAGAEFESLRQLAIDLGADTVYSASEAALAIEELAKAGIPVEDILNGAADGAVALAAAGGVSLPEAATVASNAMNQFGIEADKVTEIADILAGVANTSAADVSGLGQSLSQVGAVANLAGLDFEDTAIAIGQLADAGINGSDAGTSLKTMLNNLIPSTEAQSSAFKELGLLTYDLGEANKFLASEGLATQDSMDGVKEVLGAYAESMDLGREGTQKNAKAVDEMLLKVGALDNAFFDANGNIKSLGEVQGVLNDATKDLTREQRLAALEVLFGADAMRASAILSENGAEGYQKFADAVGETSAADVAKTRLDNLSGSVEEMQGAFDSAMITIGTIFLPIVRKVVDAITSLINIFNELPAGVQKAIAILALVASSGLIVVGMLIALAPAILSVVANFLLFRGAMIAVRYLRTLFTAARTGTLTMATFSAANSAAATSATRLGRRSLLAGKMLLMFGKMARAAWLLATGPIGIAIAAIAALGAIGYVLYQRWEPFREIVDKVAAALKEKLIAAWVALKPVLAQAWELLKDLGNFLMATLMPVLRDVGAQLMDSLGEAFETVMDSVKTYLLPALRDLADTFMNDVVPAMKTAWQTIKPVVMQLMDLYITVQKYIIVALMVMFYAFVKYVLPILIKFAAFILKRIIPAAAAFLSGVIRAISGVIKILSGFIKFFKALFTGDWEGVWEAVKQIMSGWLDIILGLLQAFFAGGIGAILKNGFNFVKNYFMQGWNIVTTIVSTAMAMISAVLTTAWALFNTIIVGGLTRIWTFIMTVLTAIKDFWVAIFTGISDFVMAIFNAIKGVIQGVLGVIKGIITGNLTDAKNSFFSILGAIRDGVTGAWNAVTTMFQTAVGGTVTAITTKAQEIIDWFEDLPGEIISAIGDLAGELYDIGVNAIQGLIEGIGSMGGNLLGAAGDLAGDLAGAFTGALNINSPSKLFRKYGQFTMDGQIIGMEDKSEELKSAARSAAGLLSDSWMNNLAMVDPVLLASTASANSMAALAPTPTPSAQTKGGAEDGKTKLRLVEGQMTIDEDSRVWVRGIAEEVVDDEGASSDRFDRMGRP